MELIKRKNLVDETYGQLLNILSSGAYPEGSKLPSENQLCEQLGVSRNTVRTAMSKLIALGIVENRQGYGNCVRSLNVGLYTNTILPCLLVNAQDIKSVMEFRVGFESMAAKLAAERATNEEIQQLFLSCEDLKRNLGTEEFARIDIAAHRMIAEMSRNPLLVRTSEMFEVMYTTWMIGYQRDHGTERSYEYHYKIYQAIARHDGVDAENCMKSHLEEVLNNVVCDIDHKHGSASV